MKETTPVPDFRRATDAEIATARAYVDWRTADWADDRDTAAAREDLYAEVLEVVIFTNGGRHTQPPEKCPFCNRWRELQAMVVR